MHMPSCTCEDCGKLNISECGCPGLQAKIAQWRKKNFPDASKLEGLAVVTEELGELAHVIVKQHQGIRKDSSTDAHLEDALGDTTIALMALADMLGYDLLEVAEHISKKVLQRDWLAEMPEKPI